MYVIQASCCFLSVRFLTAKCSFAVDKVVIKESYYYCYCCSYYLCSVQVGCCKPSFTASKIMTTRVHGLRISDTIRHIS